MINEAEGRRLAALPKKATDVLVWTDRLNHAGVKHCASETERQLIPCQRVVWRVAASDCATT